MFCYCSFANYLIILAELFDHVPQSSFPQVGKRPIGMGTLFCQRMVQEARGLSARLGVTLKISCSLGPFPAQNL